MGKAFYIADNELNAVHLSLEEALAKKLTNWRGWSCSAGYENIHITADGNVYGATCKIDGLLANIYDSFGSLPEAWTICRKDVCACGSDMQLKKTKQRMNIDKAENLLSKNLNVIKGTEIDAQFAGPIFDSTHTLTCTWDLGRRCNYSCDYCNDSISNNYESHKSWGSLEFAYSKIKKTFCKNRLTKFVFTGGEPTINPDYMKLVETIQADGHIVHTQTNGSRTPDYYSELIKKSFIGISVHLKFYNKARLISNLEAIIATKKSDPAYQFQWLGIRIMVPPGRGQEAVELYEELTAKMDFDQEKNHIHLCHTYLKNDAEKLEEYSPEEFKLIEKYT